MAQTMRMLIALDHSDSSFETFQFYLDKFDRQDYGVFVYHIAVKPSPATGHSRGKKDQENKASFEQGIEDLEARAKAAVKASGHGIAQNYQFEHVVREHDQAKPYQVVNMILAEITKQRCDMVVIGAGCRGHLEPEEHKRSLAISDQVVNRTKVISLVMTPDKQTNFIYGPTHQQHVARLKP